MLGMADGTLPLIQSSKWWTIEAAFDGGRRLAAMLERMHWTLLKAPAGETFITSDNPVTFFEPVRIPGPIEWIFSLGLQMLFPVSPQRLIFADFTKGEDHAGPTSVRTVQMMNSSVIELAHLEICVVPFSRTAETCQRHFQNARAGHSANAAGLRSDEQGVSRLMASRPGPLN